MKTLIAAILAMILFFIAALYAVYFVTSFS